MKANVRFAKELSSERSIARFIPLSSHISDQACITRTGEFISTWKVDGICHETADPGDVQLALDQLNTLYKAIGGKRVAIWAHQVRRQIKDTLKSKFTNDFARDVDKKYFDSFDNYKMMSNELYISLVYRPYANKADRNFSKARQSIERIKDMLREQLVQHNEVCAMLESSMRKYGLERLGCYLENGQRFSTSLEFYNYLISGVWQKIRVPKAPLYEVLGSSWLYFGTETIEIRSPLSQRFARGIDFKDYNSYTEPGILNSLMYLDCEYIVTHSFSFIPKRLGQEYLEKQQKQLQNSDDGAVSQIEEMSIAINDLLAGEFAMGEYHFSMIVFGDSIDDVRRNTADAITGFTEMGFVPAVISTATDAAFYAQLPGNWFYRPRIANLTSRNFAGLCSFHNFGRGKRDGNPWGQALTMLKTQGGQPFYFNFHATKEEEDSFDKKPLGNTRIIGQSGAGKTVLMTFLLTQAQKYSAGSSVGFSTVFLDKDRGAELAIRAAGGTYFALQNGHPSGMNPFQLEPTESNKLFLQAFVKKLVTMGAKSVSTADEQRIAKAVNSVMGMPQRLRNLTTVSQNITQGSAREEREDSIIRRLSKWLRGNQYGWVFDNDNDIIDFAGNNNFGFDGTDFLDNPDICSPISMYLLYRMESVIDGRRFIYFMDECWKWINDDEFSEFANNKQLTIRKQNGLGVFATQMPSSLLESPNASALVQQTATEIYLPNPKADFDEYIKGFKVSEAEFEIIKNLDVDSRMFLVKQGLQSALVKLDLAGMGEELAILSGSTDDIELADSIRQEVGDNPSDWMPVFHQRRKERKK